MNPERIGMAAGAIWHCLEKETGAITMAKLKEKTELDTELLCLGLGWLARENKVEIEKRGRTVRVSLAAVAAA
jgi:hypothetical protein